LFNPSIRNELNITHGQFGTIYASATICSSLLLVWFGKNCACSIGMMVSNGFLTIAPVITSIAENFGTFLIFGLSPAAKVFIILNFKDFFLLRFLVSFELIANPSNAVLFAAG
jgi:hypothetical protein